MHGRRLGYTLHVVAVLTLAVTACESPEELEPAPRPAIETTAAPEEPSPPSAATKVPVEDAPAIDESGKPLAEIPLAAPLYEPDTAALPPEPQIDDDPAQLIGLDRTGVDSLLGRPDLVRREPPAEIWQYRGDSCVIDVFLYEEAGAHRVTYVEARDGAARRIEARGCLNDLLRARLDASAG